MVIVWLLLMGLFVAWLAVPAARSLGWSYGRFGRVGDIVVVVIGALLGGVVLTWLLGLIGLSLAGDIFALVLGFIGALLAVGILVFLGAASASAEETGERQTPPSHQIDDTGQTAVTARMEDDPGAQPGR